MRCAIWYHLQKIKNVKNTNGGVLLKVTLLHGCVSRFLSFTNGTKSRNATHNGVKMFLPQDMNALASTKAFS